MSGVDCRPASYAHENGGHAQATASVAAIG
jgi:hypothetical protein